ncbi:CHAP domain-containing protein [Coemansia mojavensis]|nr:CHAP domain-containing protein [Coemansia mojavensis]
MKFFVSVILCLAVLASVSSAYKIYKATSVNCRSGPGTSYKSVKSYTTKDNIKLTCQTSGQNIKGNTLWGKTTDGCYIADYYLHTGSNGYVVKKCGGSKPPSGGGSGGKIPGPMTNDYPYRGKCGGVDPWNYYKCQCTSFVAWRINKRLGVKFHNHYKGPNWGNANTWDNAAKQTGVPVNSKPVPGCVAQTNAGRYGHVAWVTKVSGNSVTVEEYNHGGTERYGTRTVPKNSFNYIHIKV